MDDIKFVIAKNITALRQAKGITQIELAQMLNYSDKAISKWERGESVPDISVLYHITEIFGVTLDYLVHPHKEVDDSGIRLHDAAKKRNHIVITCMSVLLVWLVATTVFVILDVIPQFQSILHSLSFLYALPVSFVVWLVFNSVWFNTKINYIIVSLIMWSCLAAIHISFLPFGLNIWILYALGIPGQIIILLWSGIKYPKQSKFTRKLKDKATAQTK